MTLREHGGGELCDNQCTKPLRAIMNAAGASTQLHEVVPIQSR